MKKIIMFLVMSTLLLTACGGKADELQTQVDDLQAELKLAESTVGICVTSLEEEIAAASSLRDTLTDTLGDLAASEDDLQACLDELEAETTGEEVGGGESECAGTERIVMISTPVLQQAVSNKGEPRYNDQGKMVMTTVSNERIDDFSVGDVVCVTEHYPVSGGWAVFLISGTREAYFNLFIPAYYLEPLP